MRTCTVSLLLLMSLNVGGRLVAAGKTDSAIPPVSALTY